MAKNADIDTKQGKSLTAETSTESHMSCFLPGFELSKGKLLSLEVDVKGSEELQILLAGELAPFLVQTAWALVLRIYTGQDDVCFRYQQVEGHSLLRRVLVDETLSILQTVERLRTSPTEVHHASGSTEPLYNTTLSTLAKSAASNANSSLKPVLSEQAQLSLEVQFLDHGLKIFFVWQDLEKASDHVLNIASTLQKVLHQSAEAPDTPIRDLDHLSDRNKDQICNWNKGSLESVEVCIHEIIHDRAFVQPQKEALCSSDESLSYHELDSYSSHLARYLIAQGVEHEDFVPLLFDKSVWNVVAMISVLKAGAAFVPLDPLAPLSRLQTLASNVKANIVLCSQQHSIALASIAKTIIPIDGPMIRNLPEHDDQLPKVNSTDLAYLIWTSGSTGEPKGTMIEHGAYCTGAKSHGPAMLMRSESRALQFASHTFDASLVEIVTILMVGGTVCIPSEEERLNSITTTMENLQVNWAVLTPSFVGLIDPAEVPGLKTLVMAGESMSQMHVDKWSHIELVNGYGPSEASVAAAVQSHVTPRTSPKNIGYPTGVHLWVASPDDHHRLVPIGCVGELLIQGPTLARGYLNQSEKTEESFVPDPGFFEYNQKKWRVYKTGDLVRQNVDGTFSFIGRKDNQVKVRGQRVELGEIEHHLVTDPSVKHGLVLLPKAGPFRNRLVSVVSLSHTNSSQATTALALVPHRIRDPDQIRERLSSLLPAYMVPSLVLVVESLPFLPSGKLDRKRAQKWVESTDDEAYRSMMTMTKPTQTAEEAATPAIELQSKLRLIWSHVLNLNIDQVDLNRSFMSMGGDSISAIQVKGQCSKLKISLTVQDILRSKSIKQLSQFAKTLESSSHHEEIIGQHFDLSPIQQLYFALPNQGHGHFNQSFFLRVSRNIQEEHLRLAIEIIIQRHSMLRARFVWQQSTMKWQQRITDDVSGSYRLKSHQIDHPENAHPAIADSQTCLDTALGPIFAADIFQVEGGKQLLFLVGHHLVIDLVSWRVILEDLEELLSGSPHTSDEKPASFQTWCQMQADHCQKLAIDKVLPNHSMPKDDHVPLSDASYWGMLESPNTYGTVDCKGFEVDQKATSMMLTQCHNALRTDPVDILLSSLIHSFALTFEDRNVPTIYNEAHGREPSGMAIDISRTVGWFTAMYPVHIHESASKDLINTVRHVKDFRRRVADNGRPYFAARFLTDEGRDRFSHHWPLEVTFNYLGQYQQLERQGALLMPADAMAGETRGAGGIADVGLETPRFGLFEISAVIAQGKLRFSFTFNRGMKHQGKIHQWILSCQQMIISMVSTLAEMAPEATLSDFPLLSISYDDLQTNVSRRLKQIGISTVEEVEDIYPCSSMQEGLLISQTKSSAFYAVRVIYELVSADLSIDADRLSQAWQQVVDRHAALRTVFVPTFSTNEGLYDQVVLKDYASDIIYMDCSNRNFAVRKLSEEVDAVGANRPPHRFTICKVSGGNLICKLEISHAIMDGASMSIIFRDLALACTGSLMSEPKPLYSDYISFLQNQPTEASVEFWKTYLAEVEPCIFPTLNDGLTAPKELRSLRLDFIDSDYIRLRKFCETNGWTLSNVLHMAWSLTLRCYTSSDDVSFGYLISGRDSLVNGIEEAVGPFINMLVCRIGMEPKSRLGSVLDNFQKDYMDSLLHSTTSLAEVQHALHLSGSPLFNTALSFRRLPQEQSVPSKVSFKECVPIYDPTEYSVSVNVEASENDILIDLDYWTDHMSPGQAANVGSAFLQALSMIIDNPDNLIEDTRLFSSMHDEQLQEWNRDIPKALGDCVHKVISRQAYSQPDAPAVCAWDASFTFAELDAVSTRLAQCLIELGVGPEVCIPTCFDKSAWTIVAMLGVLKAGGAAVPLDATHPRNALELRVKDTRAKIVLASPSCVDLFEDMGVSVICVSDEDVNRLPAPTEFEGTMVGPENPCFIIYTSGSTGKPKGVVLEHRAIVSSSHATGTAYGFGSHSRVLQFAAYTFDNSLAEIFITLMHGGCVCVPSEHERFNDLAGAINKLGVNFADITPTVAGFLRPSEVPGLKALSLGGEALTKEAIETWVDAVSLHCCYGPSECSINSTWNGDLGRSSEATNIGKSIGSVSWIVDPDNHDYLVPTGSVGELLIEGPILARGYLNDPEKTDKVFICSPRWANGEQKRMYKTGDLARNNSDGTITYLGRKDFQVKLNGQRIELGEIEHHVKSNLPSDAQSAVELISLERNKRATKALAAFFCVESNASVPASGLGNFILPMSESMRLISTELETSIASSLPSYMVPRIYIPVKAMPTTSSGKLDRKALRSSCKSLSEAETSMYRLASKSGRPPSSSMEKLLAELWEQTLNLEANTVGLDDNFFRLGGDSVAAIKLISAARSKGISLAVAKVFTKPVLMDLALDPTLLSVGEETYADQAPVEPFSLCQKGLSIQDLLEELASQCRVHVDSIQDIYPCTAIQEGLIALSNKDPGAYVAQNIYRLSANINLAKFQQAWEKVVEAELILRTRIVYLESYGFLQVVVQKPISWHYLTELQDIVQQDRHLPPHNGGDLSMYSIVEDNGAEPIFIWTAHHALYDGWCIPLMLQRVEACYYDISSMDKVIGSAYPKFIRYLSEINANESENFWKLKLSGTTAVHFPPLPHPSYQVHATGSFTHSIQIRREAGTHITLPSTIRAAWAIVVATYSGASNDVIFGEILTGRDVPVSDVTNIIGPTLATVPTRVQVDSEMTISQFLKDVQVRSAETIPFQHTGLQHIKNFSEHTAHACGFQNLLAIHHDEADLEDGFWNLQSGRTVGTNFYSYPLTISCQIGHGQVEIEVHYDQEVISTWMVEKVMSEFEFLIERFNSPEMMNVRLGEMSLLTRQDESLIQKWNSGPLYFAEDCIHHLIQKVALEQPESKAAVESWDATLTYRELICLSSQLAGRLVETGARDTLLPLCFEKSAWAIVTMLAILLSGATFVPLDPEASVSDLKDIVGDTNAQLILCSPKYEQLCSKFAAVMVVQRDVIENWPKMVGIPTVASIGPAYVTFTSGTTGKPKGTIVQHRTFCSRIATHGPALRMDSSSRVLQFAKYTHDASLLEILMTLTIGGCVCVPRDDRRMDFIADVITEMKVSWALLSPSFIQLIQPSTVPTLQTLVLTGESMARTQVSTWADKLQLLHAYGSAEVSVVATVSTQLSLTADPTNIGHAIGCHSWIVDLSNSNRLVPIGAQGELVFDSPALSQGYLNKETMTSEAFFNPPNWALKTSISKEVAQRKLYRTGDIVKYTSNGDLIYCGRKNTLTKQHGRWLALAEIEHRLRTDPFIQHAMVIVPKDGACKNLLVAVISLQELAAANCRGAGLKVVVRDANAFYLPVIRERLCDKLPASSVPSEWVILQSLPILESGKLDRHRIERWVEEINSETYHQIANLNSIDLSIEGTKLEMKLQKVLAAALNLPLEVIGLHQSFLHLGGDSLSAMHVVSKCRAEGLGTSVKDIIQSRSISDLALRVTLPEEMAEEVEATDQWFGLSPIQKLYFECIGDLVNHFNQSVLLKLTRRMKAEHIATAMEAVVDAHSMLRAHFARSESGEWQQSISRRATYRFLTRSTSFNQIPSFIQESQESLDIKDGPVLAVDLFDTEDQGQILSIVAHHLVIDVVSWRIILQDLEDILQGVNTKPQSALSFQKWSHLQVEHTQSIMSHASPNLEEVPVANLGFWDMENKPNTYGDVIENRFELDSETSLRLLGASHEAMGSETVDVLLASVLQSFRKVFSSRSTMPTIYNEGHGREPWEFSTIDLSRTVGWFTTMCPIFLPTRSENNPDLLNAIRWVKDLRRRIPQKGRPYFAYRMLTEEGQERFSNHWPMEIAFNYLGKMQQPDRNDTLFQTVSDPNIATLDIGRDVPRFALFEISASVTNGSLKMTFSYNRNMRRQAKIHHWIDECERCLRDAANRLVQIHPERTLSDFPLLPLAYDGISKLVQLLPQLGVRSIDGIEDVYPCSPVQQGMLLAQSKDPELYAYSTLLEVHAQEGHLLNPHALADAWQAVLHRHPVLRTVFIDSICQKGLNDQVVLRDTSARIAWLECEDSQVKETFEQQKPISFVDFQPPHRLTLCKTNQNRVFCKLELSHAICDGTSMPILLRDFALAYTQAPAHMAKTHALQNLELPPAAPRYSDYIAHILSNRSTEVDLNYWKAYLAGAEPCHLDVLNDNLKVEKNLRTLVLPLTDSSELERFCGKNGFTMSNVLQFVWAMVLKAYVGTDEVAFGYLTSGRDAPIQGIQDAAVGAFINMLTCRIRLDRTTPVNEALHKIQTDFVNGMAHQSCSLADVQHELQLSSRSLFNTAFTFQKRTEDRVSSVSSAPTIEFGVLDAHDPNEYDVTVNIEAMKSGVEVHLGYWTTCLSDAQAMNIVRTFDHVLNEIISRQKLNYKIGDLDLFSDHSSKQVMHWNRRLPVTVDRCIHDVIHGHVVRKHTAPAVCARDATLSYPELDEISTRLAFHLVELGVGPETYVPLCFQKSAWMVVSMIAVLKAGGAFCPLDHTQPHGRLKSFVDDVRGDLILCSQESFGKLSGACTKIIVVDMNLVQTLSYPAETYSFPRATPNNSAYIIFTSGTTGRPKGTIIEHGAFCTSALEHSRAMDLTSMSRVLQFASHTFDASVMEILTTLIVGGCVCIPSEQDRMNNLPGVIKSMKVTWTLLTPSVASTLSPRSVPSLKVLVTGGEKMTPGHIAKWKGHCSLVNAYGPSETSVIASVGWKVDKNGNEVNTNPANIGQAVGGRAWIVDPYDYNKLVPVGGIGELVVEGRTVARGYLNNDVKTAECFISDPPWLQSMETKQRLYRTGDLVHYNSDGTLSFVSRKDTQIKLNGQRIELGEIEYNVKVGLPEDYLSAVELVAPMSRIATKALAVFFTHQVEDHGSVEDERVSGVDEILLSMSNSTKQLARHLDSSLATVLPAYMIPSFYVPVTRLPWTSAGKLDRARLRNILQTLPTEITEQYRPTGSDNKSLVGPTSAMEKKLQSVWENVLNIVAPKSISAEDSFFRLGGDSVTAMNLVGLARSEGISLTVSDIFKNPRLCDMASVCTTLVENHQSEIEPFSLLKSNEPLGEILEEVSQQCRVDKQLISDAYPCSLLQEGLVTLSIRQTGAYVIRNVFKLPKDLDVNRFKTAWERTVEDLAILRTRIVHMKSSAFVQIVLQHDPIEWNMVENLDNSHDFDIPADNGGVLTRYTIARGVNSGDTHFMWQIHHALFDGFSLPMILRRVEKLYHEESLQLPKSLYSSFIQYLTSTDEEISNEYWRTTLDGAAPLQFPQHQKLAFDHSGASQVLTHTTQISKNTASMGFTVATTIRAAWAMVVAAYSGSNDVVFGETMAGRNIPVPGITDVVGPTITTIPTRIQIDRGDTVAHFLQQVQKMATDVITYQHVGLQRIKRLSSYAELACDFQNLLVIQTLEEKVDSRFWDLQTDEVASNFFTYPLVLECKGHSNKVQITAHYDSSVLSQWQTERIMCQLDTVLRQFSDLPKLGMKTRLHSVEVFSPQDKALVQKWNADIPRIIDSCIHDDFEDKVVTQPQAQAVHAWDGSFTYRELLDHATHLAHHLAGLGVGPEVFVPICMDKSAWAIVGILGILLAGGAFVPLDPLSPRARHQEMIKDVNAKLVLCSLHHRDQLTGLLDDILVIDQELLDSFFRLPAPTQTLRRALPRNAAYAIFTSGSTGKPKGTVVEHRAISTSSVAMQRALLMSPNARVFQFASFTFDVSVLEMFTTLTCGGCVCIPSEDMRTSNVSEAICSLNATWAFLTPSVANLIEPATVPSLNVLVCGGEPMSIDNVQQWASKVTLINGYGPTEASVIAISNSSVTEQGNPSNVGFALSSGRAWIADSQDHNLIAPVGCVGELLLSGPLLAREYINDPFKTEESFVDWPSWADAIDGTSPNTKSDDEAHICPPYRMYKTGDLVRYNEDGSIVFIGRKDHQVKLHGQRMELGEIEHLLDLDSEIQHAIVALPKDGPFRKRLVAVVSLNTLATSEITKNSCNLVLDEPRAATGRAYILEARNRLTDRLPPYMIPSSWLLVDSIPIRASGKIDRPYVETWLHNIDDLTYERILEMDEENEDTTPATKTGRILQRIISRVLNIPIEKLPLSKSFLSLGGDSITSMQVMAHCRKEKINFSLTDVLKSKSIHELASKARYDNQAQHQDEIEDQDFDLSPIQKLYFQSQAADSFQGPSRFNQSFSLNVTRRITPEDLSSAVQKIVDQHSMLRARFRKGQQGTWQQRVTRRRGFDNYQVHHIDLESEIAPLIRTIQSGLNIQQGPLFVVDLFNVGEERQILFLVAHHLVIDMVSWRIIIQDLEEVLNTGALGSEKPLSFLVWCAMQQDHTRKATVDDSRATLPFNVPPSQPSYWELDSSQNTYGDVICETFTVNEYVTKLALGDCNKPLRTDPIELFLAAIAHSFSRVFFDRDVPAIFNETHGREPWDSDIDISRTVGWFTSIFPVHVPIDTERDDPVETVRRMKDTRRSVPDNGRPNFARQLLTTEATHVEDSQQEPMEILFNYLGRMQQLEHDEALFQQWDHPEDEETSAMVSDVGPKTTRLAIFELSASVVRDKVLWQG
ncbi:acetyl-CoA synthetase-like protein [Mollisia scopiformis]|uniref:Acetyl-CoA synthetase-like protein n=1 Tax=Mollisia scopiformis TaxID=149040 RepID=A0A132B1L2_MOLSC|nr:acetyl-CoA synthetase-like protein [Mollisia scopiformis]KUJ06201.1 acetyl-CoA synthetase-like protein [Mollisia scopiformis]